MAESKNGGLTDLSDEQIDAIAGGYIVDMGPQPDDSYNRYVLVKDKTGEIITMTSDIESAEWMARPIMSGYEAVEQKGASTKVISVGEYESIFGRPLF